jgi:hypothetical protein
MIENGTAVRVTFQWKRTPRESVTASASAVQVAIAGAMLLSTEPLRMKKSRSP